RPPCSPLFPYTTLFRSVGIAELRIDGNGALALGDGLREPSLERVHPAEKRVRFGARLLRERRLIQANRARVIALLLALVTTLERSEEHTSELQSPYDLV